MAEDNTCASAPAKNMPIVNESNNDSSDEEENASENENHDIQSRQSSHGSQTGIGNTNSSRDLVMENRTVVNGTLPIVGSIVKCLGGGRRQ